MLEHTYFLKSGQKWISFLALDDDFDNSIKKCLYIKIISKRENSSLKSKKKLRYKNKTITSGRFSE